MTCYLRPSFFWHAIDVDKQHRRYYLYSCYPATNTCTVIKHKNKDFHIYVINFFNLHTVYFNVKLSTYRTSLRQSPTFDWEVTFLINVYLHFFYCNLMNLLPRQIHHQSSIPSTFGNSVFYLFFFFERIDDTWKFWCLHG